MNIKPYFLGWLLCLTTIPVFAQGVIEYGSNKGKYILIEGKKIYYEEYGKGIPLLLLHGGLSSISSFNTVIPDLQKYFRVIAMDAPGEGRSEQADSLSFKLLATYASGLIDALKLDSVYVYGFSLGAITALQLATWRQDKVVMTVVHAGIFHYDGYGPGFGGDKITPALMEAHPNIWLNDHLKKTPEKKLWKKFLADFNKMWSQRAILSEDDLKRIVHPVLVIQGDRDLVKMEHAVRMHQLIRNSQLCILPSTTHFVLFENPPLIAKAVLDFFLRKGALRKMNR